MLFIGFFATPVVGTVSAAVGINHQINFQGKLVNPNGTNVTDGSYSVVFSAYTVSTAGTATWTETQSVTVTSGVFQVNLGSVTALPASIDFNTDNIYLGVKVGADAEMTPRIQFTAVPQSFNSEKLGGLDKTGYVQNTTSQQASTNFNISGTGVATILQAGTFDASSAAALNIGITNASSLTVAKAGVTTTISGSLSVTQAASFNSTLTVAAGSTFTNASSTLVTAISVANLATGGSIGTAATTVDVATTINIVQTTAGQTLTLANPTNTTAGRIAYIGNTGTVAFTLSNVSTILSANTATTLIWNGSQWTSAGVDSSGANYIQNQSTNGQSANFLIQSTATNKVTGGLRALASQTADQLQLQAVNGEVLAIFSAAGALTTYGTNTNHLGLTTPIIASTSTAVAGGSLAAGTYYYVVTATNALGETVASSSASQVTTGTTSTVTVNWTQVNGATGYKIYRNTSNSFTSGTLLASTITSGATASYVDSGAVTTGAFPASTTAGNKLAVQGWASQTNNIFEVQSAMGSVAFGVNSSTNPFSNGGFVINNGGLSVSGSQSSSGANAGQVLINNTGVNGVAASRGIIVRANSAQSANTLEVQDASSNQLSAFGATGQLILGNDLAAPQAGSITFNDATATNGFVATLNTSTLTAARTISLPNASGTLCLQASTSCGFATSATGAAAIVQGGNSFGATADIGTNDNFNLFFRTNGSTKLAIDTTGSAYFNQASTLGVYTTSVANAAGLNLTVAAGAANGSTTGAAGGNLTFLGGAAAGSGNNNGGNITLDGGSLTGTGSKGFIVLQGTAGLVGVGTAAPTEKLHVSNGNALIDNGNLKFAQVSAPTAPTAAINATAGNLTGTYLYKISFVTGQGETSLGTASGSVAPAAQQVNLTAIATGTAGVVTQRKVYRTLAGGLIYYFVATIADNVTTIFTDNTADGSLTLVGKAQNTTGGVVYLNGFQIQLTDIASTNTAQGYLALASNTSGFSNSAAGSSALTANTTGFSNSALGVGSLQANTVGAYNTAAGFNALSANISGSFNSAFGTSAFKFSTGNNNSGFGLNAGLANVAGSQNTAVGSNALRTNTAGSNNSALGYQALYSTIGSQNTAVGYNAGYQDSAGLFKTVANLQNASTFGAYTQVQASNSIVLGSIDTATNVGIGTTIPLNRFSVSPVDYSTGTASQSLTTVTGVGTTWTSAMVGEQFIFADGSTGTITAFTSATSLTLSTSQTVASQAYRIHKIGLQVTSAGNVGIGLSAPAYPLDVSGVVRGNNEIISTLGNGLGQFRAIGGNYGTMFRQDGADFYLLNTASADQYGAWNSQRPLTVNNATGNVALGNNSLYVQNAGNVGIGTASPSQKLDVQGGNINTSGYYQQAGQIVVNTTTGTNNTFVGVASGNTTTSGNNNAAFGTNSLLGNTTGYQNTALGGSTLQLNTIGNGNTATGTSALQNNTSGSTNTAYGVGSLQLNTTGSNNTSLGYSASNTDSGGNFKTGAALQNATTIGSFAQVQANNSIVLGSVDTVTKVGIGTTIPLNTFSVSPVDYSTGTASQSLTTVTGVGTTWTSAMVGEQFIFADGSTGTITAFTSATSLTLSTSQTVASQAYRIHRIGLQVTSAGNVGIGTSSPSAALDVRSSGTLVANFQTTISPAVQLTDGTRSGQLGLASSPGNYSNIAAAGDTVLRASSNNVIISAQNAAGSIYLTTGASDTAKLTVLSGGNVGIGTISPNGQLEVVSNSATTVGLIVRAAASQSANILEIRNSSNAVLAKVDSAGYFSGANLTPTDFSFSCSKQVGLGSAAPSYARYTKLSPTTISVNIAYVTSVSDSGNFRLNCGGLPVPRTSNISLPASMKIGSAYYSFNLVYESGIWWPLRDGGTSAAGYAGGLTAGDTLYVTATYEL